MMNGLMLQLWNDDSGALIAIEFLLVATILIFGIIVGLVSVRQAVVSELVEYANTVLSINQAHAYSGLSGCCSSVEGVAVVDNAQPQVTPPACTTADPVTLNAIPCMPAP